MPLPLGGVPVGRRLVGRSLRLRNLTICRLRKLHARAGKQHGDKIGKLTAEQSEITRLRRRQETMELWLART
jgi:hypothetical protein